jgi:predicted transcriptional regulator
MRFPFGGSGRNGIECPIWYTLTSTMKITVRSDGFEGYKKRALARAAKLARLERVRPEITITFDNPLEMLEVLTAERIRLCETARQQPYSITALAAELKRDPKSVRRDVLKLEAAGVIRLQEQINPGHGRVRIVEPAAKRFELIASF